MPLIKIIIYTKYIMPMNRKPRVFKRKRRFVKKRPRLNNKDIAKIKQMPYPDLKYHTSAALDVNAGTIGNTAGLTIRMALIDQGITENTRIGDDIKLKSVHMNLRFQYLNNPSTATDGPTMFRWAIVYARAAAVSDDFTDIFNLPTVVALRAIPRIKDYKILAQGNNYVSYSHNIDWAEVRYNAKNLLIRYNDAVPTVSGDFDYGEVFFVVICDTTHVNAQLGYNFRLAYTDM